jgi:dipeptidase E
MKQSGFDQIIVDLLKQDKIAYGGFSAGSVIAAPTLKGIDIIDDPAIVTEGYDSEIIWEGLKLIDFSIVPHYQSNHPESKLADSVAAFFKINGYPFKTMRDGDVLIMNGTELELLSVD